MKLHRVEGGKADWERTDPAQWNFWQRWAAKTRGWATLANAATATGNGMVGYGMYEVASHNSLLGLAFVAIGRGMDLLDGALAEKTKTKSPLGEFLDAGSDKLQTAAALGVLAVEHVMPPVATVTLAAEQAAIVGLTAIAKKRGRDFHASKWGKLLMGSTWVSLGAWIGERAVETISAVQTSVTEAAAHALDVVGLSGLAGTVALSGLAIHGYVRDTWGPEPQTQPAEQDLAA